ncbi:MAG: FecR domain-containing protein [Rikenellaceae bacterium]
MTLKDKNNKKSDQAWNLLYSRLEQEGLLNEKEVVRQSIFHSAALKWAASLAILITITLLIRDVNISQTDMLTLYNGEEISTFVTTLEDGSVVYLAKNASLSYPRHFQKRKREVFLQGDAFFEVSKNARSPFIIETGLIKIEVLGTSFNVKISDKVYSSLSVNSGEVKVTLKRDGQSTRITAGETLLIHTDRLQKVQTHDMEQFTRYSDCMHFKDERLADVIRVINRNLDGLQLEVAPELEERLLTATFSKNSADSMAQFICIALNLKYSQQYNTIRIYE